MFFKRLMEAIPYILITLILLTGLSIALMHEANASTHTATMPSYVIEHLESEATFIFKAAEQRYGWVVKLFGILFGCVIGLLIYIYKKDMHILRTHVTDLHVNNQQDIADCFDEINEIKKDFMATDTHTTLCDAVNKD